jgi:hypothetical protein
MNKWNTAVGLLSLGGLSTACGAPSDEEPAQFEAEQLGEELHLVNGVASVSLGQLIPRPPVTFRCGFFATFNPPRPFDFDDRTAQGWQLDGIYHGGTNTRVRSATGPAWWTDNTDYPNALGGDPNDGAGTAVMPILGDASVALGQSSPNGFHHMDFVSAPLQRGWEGFTRYQYKVLQAASSSAAVYAQLLVKVRKCDGTEAYLRDFNAGQPHFCLLRGGQQWTSCTADITWPSDIERALELVVRIFFSDEGLYEGGVYLDDVGIRPTLTWP